MSWGLLERGAPELARAGRRLLVGEDGVAIAFLATCSGGGAPHLSPVCPIFCGEGLYLSAATKTPKARDLQGASRQAVTSRSVEASEGAPYVLHAFLGENDEEFQVAGRAFRVNDEAERSAVHAAIPFASFQAEDPIFRLEVTRALRVHWERVGQPDTRAVRERWSAAAAGG